MAVTFTREFYINFGLFLFACLALALSIWAFATGCKKDKFGDQQCKSIDYSPTSDGVGCPPGSLGPGQPCDLFNDKCCGSTRSSHLICQSNSGKGHATCQYD